MPNYNSRNFLESLAPGDTSFVFGIPTNAALSASPAGAVRNQNVVTFTTAAAHNFVPGMPLTALGVGSVLGTRFDGNYIILTVPSTTTLTAQPVDPVGVGAGNSNQANDTGGGGNVKSVAAEQPAVVPQASVAIALADRDSHDYEGLALEIFWTGVPGACEVDLQEADTNTDSAFINVQVGTAATPADAKLTSATTLVARIDIINIVAKFARVLIKTRTNAVGIVARLSR